VTVRLVSALVLICLCFSSPQAFAQTVANASDAVDQKLTAGRDLVNELEKSSDPAAVFNRVGMDRASELLLSVTQRGMQPSATAQDWSDMHKAFSDLITLEVSRSNQFKAAVWAQMQAVTYRGMDDDYEQALVFSRKSLELQQQSGFLQTIYTRYLDVGTDLVRLGHPDEGLVELQKARQTAPDTQFALSAAINRNIVGAALQAHNRTLAQQELDRFLRASESKPAAYRAEALLSRADVMMDSGKYQEAVDTGREAFLLAKGDQTLLWEVTSVVLRCILAAIHTLSYDDGLTLAKSIQSSFSGLPISVVGFTEGAIRTRRRLAGDLDALLRESMRDLEAARLRSDIGAQVQTLRDLAVTYQSVNDTQDRVTVLREAASLEAPKAFRDDDAGSSYSYSLTIRMLGDAHVDDEDYDSAAKAYKRIRSGIDGLRSARLKSNLRDLYADAILGEARVDEALGDYDAGRQLLAQAERGEIKSAVFDHMYLFLAMARLEKAAANRAESVKRYEQAIEAAMAARDAAWELAIRVELAQYLASAPALSPAVRDQVSHQLSEIASKSEKLKYADIRWRQTLIAGLLAENSGDRWGAVEHYRSAVDQLDGIRAGVTFAEARSTVTATNAAALLYTHLIGLLTDVGRTEDAFEYVERRKARAFLEMLHGRRFEGEVSNRDLANLQQMEKQMVNLQWQLADTATLKLTGDDPRALRAQLVQLQAQFTLARHQASLQTTRAGQALSLKPLTLAQVQAQLPTRTALIEYSFVNEKAIAFVLTRAGAVERRWAFDYKAVRTKLQAARRGFDRAASPEDLRDVLEFLSTVILKPVLADIPANIDKLVFIPTDYLEYLPFETLPIGEGRYTIDRFAVSYLPNASSLPFLSRGNRQANRPSLFLGAIGNVQVDGLPGLPATLREVQDIARMNPQADVATERDFTYERLRRALLTHDEVHMATHGLLNTTSPLFNSVLTAPQPSGTSRFSLYELTSLKVRTRLVVLSACQTDLGKLSSGDEVTGFTRMFLQAGADTVVASLWRVNDTSTAILMREFYKNLKAGKLPADALRLSELEVRKTYPSPFYWAPFVVNGLN
jgi:CHAT domain-containing protein